MRSRAAASASLGFVLGLWLSGQSTHLSARSHTELAASSGPESAEFLFVFGVVCNERQHHWRARLRKLYSVHANEVLPIFVVSDDKRRDPKWQERERSIGGRLGEDVLYAKMAWYATHVEREHAYRESHCAHKTMRWWQAAARWPSRWYGKTDDDAVIDLPPLLSLLSLLPAGPVYGGIARYSSINASNLEGGCFSSGANGAVRIRRQGRHAHRCSALEGPYPYIEGPLEILSSDVQRYLSSRAYADPRMRCHYEDLYVGRFLAAHPALSLVNLDTLIGRKDIYNMGGKVMVGADSLLAHWVRKDADFQRVADGFDRARVHSPVMGRLRCSRWADGFALLEHFPCCQNWTVCEPLTPMLRARLSHESNLTAS